LKYGNKKRKSPKHMREVLNSMLYRIHTGCLWREMPEDLLPQTTVYKHYQKWREEGKLEAISEAIGVDLTRIDRVGRGKVPKLS
jgi:transposase